jgi:xylulokinase
MATSGTLIEWLSGLCGDASIDALVAEAAATPPGADGLLVLPYFAGERSPLFDPNARGVIAGLTLSHHRGHIARAIYEALAFGVRHNLETIERVAGRPRRIVAVGGGTKTGFWPQLVSDIAAVEQVLPCQTIGASYGDALLAGIATGIVAVNADWTIERDIVEPGAPGDDFYDGLYELYGELYRDTMTIAHRLAAQQAPAQKEVHSGSHQGQSSGCVLPERPASHR